MKTDLRIEREKDSCIFNMLTEGNKNAEYALLLFRADGSFYTACIANGGAVCRVGIQESEAEKYIIAKIIDINTEEICFEKTLWDLGEKKEIAAGNNNEHALPYSQKEIDIDATPKLSFSVKDKDESQAEMMSFFSGLDVFEQHKLHGHELYIFDAALIKDRTCRVNVCGTRISPDKLFLEYKNIVSDCGELPPRIAGRFISDKGKYYTVLGVCGKNNSWEQPFGGVTGFTVHEEIFADGRGYWLMYIEDGSGRICTERP